MKLSQEVVLGLKRLCNPSLTNEERFDSLLHKSLLDLEKKDDPNWNEKKQLLSKSDIMKSGYASLMVVLTEATRHGIDCETLKTILQNYNLNATRLSSIIDLYKTQKPTIHSNLIVLGTSLPHIVDIHWRLDYQLKYSDNEYAFQPLFNIQFTLLHAEDVKRLYSFVATMEHMEELIHTLKSICNHINKLANV